MSWPRGGLFWVSNSQMYCFLVPQFVSPFAWLFSHWHYNFMVLMDTVPLDNSLWVILFQLSFQWDEYISFILVTKLIARMTLNLSWSELKVVVLRIWWNSENSRSVKMINRYYFRFSRFAHVMFYSDQKRTRGKLNCTIYHKSFPVRMNRG